MKNKLLLFLMSLFAFSSCVEYVENNQEGDGKEPPVEFVFSAKHSNPEQAKYVGDTFIFEATLNGEDVTRFTKFRINGTQILGNTYVPHRTGSNSIIATMDDHEFNFRFSVIEKTDDEPEIPAGNRIEFDGKSYPVNKTMWILVLDGDEPFSPDGVNSLWFLTSIEEKNNKINNQFFTVTTVPFGQDGSVLVPFANPASLSMLEGALTLDGDEIFESASNVIYTFAPTGNTTPNQGVGQGNYSSIMTDKVTSKTAKLFWEGQYSFQTIDINQLGKGKNFYNLFSSM